MFDLLSNCGSYTVVLVDNNKTTMSKVCVSMEDAKQVAYRIIQKKGYKMRKDQNNYNSKSIYCHNNIEFHINRLIG